MPCSGNLRDPTYWKFLEYSKFVTLWKKVESYFANDTQCLYDSIDHHMTSFTVEDQSNAKDLNVFPNLTHGKRLRSWISFM